jgi:hypothetical protein
VIGDEWDDFEEDDEPIPAVAVASVPVVPPAPARSALEHCLAFDEAFLHLRETEHVFTLCGARSLQGFQRGDARLKSLPECPLCLVASGGDSE